MGFRDTCVRQRDLLRKTSLLVSLTNESIGRWMAVSLRASFFFSHRVIRLDNTIIKILSDHRSLSSPKMDLCWVPNLLSFMKSIVIVIIIVGRVPTRVISLLYYATRNIDMVIIRRTRHREFLFVCISPIVAGLRELHLCFAPFFSPHECLDNIYLRYRLQ